MTEIDRSELMRRKLDALTPEQRRQFIANGLDDELPPVDLPDRSSRPCPTADYIEAFTAGYNACKDGVPNEAKAFIAALNEAYRMSGSQLARRQIDGTVDAADIAKIAELRKVFHE